MTAELRKMEIASLALTRATDPLDRLETAGSISTTARWLLAAAVNDARAAGASWQAIGDRLGMSRQAAHERFVHVLQDRPLPGIDQ